MSSVSRQSSRSSRSSGSNSSSCTIRSSVIRKMDPSDQELLKEIHGKYKIQDIPEDGSFHSNGSDVARRSESGRSSVSRHSGHSNSGHSNAGHSVVSRHSNAVQSNAGHSVASRHSNSGHSVASRHSGHSSHSSQSKVPKVLSTEEFYSGVQDSRELTAGDHKYMEEVAKFKKNGGDYSPEDFWNNASPNLRELMERKIPDFANKMKSRNYMQITHENVHGKTTVSGAPNVGKFAVGPNGRFSGEFC